MIASRVIQYRVREEVRRQETEEREVQCFRYWRIGHYKQECSNIEVEKEKRRSEEVTYAVSLQKTQQEKRPAYFLQRKVQKYSSVWGISLRSTILKQRGQTTKWEVITSVECREYNYKDTKIQRNQEQGFVSGEYLRNIWYSSCLKAWKQRENTTRKREAVSIKCRQYGRKDTIEGISEKDRKKILCSEYRTRRKQPQQNWRAAVYPVQEETQQGGIQTGVPKGIAREGGTKRNVRRIFKILRKVWLNIGIEKIDIHEGITVKALLDSGITGMFMDRKIAAKHGFKLQKLERPVMIRNMNGTNNSAGTITHQIEVNIYYKNHVKRMRVDVCNLGKTDIILEMLWLQVLNSEINQKTEEVKMTRCPPLCGRNTKLKEKKKEKKEKRMVSLEEKRIVRWAVDNKENWEREKKVEVDHRKIEEIVLQKFLKWKKVFGKVESERMPTRKIWDHTIDLKEMFKPRKKRIYLLSKNEREEVQNFIENQLRKGYIRLSKFPQISPVFFVSKKDREKRMIMDYCNLNDQMVKNNYPLPLITDLIDNIGSK